MGGLTSRHSVSLPIRSARRSRGRLGRLARWKEGRGADFSLLGQLGTLNARKTLKWGARLMRGRGEWRAGNRETARLLLQSLDPRDVPGAGEALDS